MSPLVLLAALAVTACSSANYQTLELKPAALEQKYPPPGQLQNQAAARGGMTRADSARLRDSNLGLRLMTTEVQSARVGRAVLSERQLLEVMTDFWLNHFSVYDAKGPRERYFLAEYENRVIRPNALGKFRTLLGGVAKSEAMLFYLDNWQSQADSGRPRLGQVAGRGGRAGRDQHRTRPHRLDVARLPAGWRVRLPAGDARRRREGRPRTQTRRTTRHRGWRRGARHHRATPCDGDIRAPRSSSHSSASPSMDTRPPMAGPRQVTSG